MCKTVYFDAMATVSIIFNVGPPLL
jgi:hypothetical protein